MRKPLIWAAALLTSTALAAPSFAQSMDYTSTPRREARAKDEAPTVNQLMAVDEARIARLKADLRLTPEQEGSWGKLESALKDISKRRADRFVAHWQEERDARDRDARDKDNRDRPVELSPMDRMRRIAEGMDLQAADLKRVADAADPIYAKLEDPQRRTLESGLREQMARPAGIEEGRRSRRAAEW